MPESAPAAPKQFFGVVAGGAADQADYKKMQRTSVGTVRFTVGWPGIQPHRNGPFDFTRTDSVVGSLASNGIRPVPTVFGSPHWVAPKVTKPPLRTKETKKAWKRFLGALVDRYGRGGDYWTGSPSPYHAQFGASAPVKAVRHWQIWNEPNLPKYFSVKKKKAPKQYGKLVKLSHQAIKQHDRKAKVLLAGLTGFAKPRAWTFLKQLYRAKGIKRAFDAAALHPYPATIKQLRGEVRRIRSQMARHHDRHTPLWITELGWGSRHGTPSQPLNKGLNGQKRMLKTSFRLLLHKRKHWRLKAVQWYTWRDPARTGNHPVCTFCDSAGLLRHNRKPKPAYRAYKHFTKKKRHGRAGGAATRGAPSSRSPGASAGTGDSVPGIVVDAAGSGWMPVFIAALVAFTGIAAFAGYRRRSGGRRGHRAVPTDDR